MRMASAREEMSPCVTVFTNISKLTEALRNALPNIRFQELSPGTQVLHSQFSQGSEVTSASNLHTLSEEKLRVLQDSEIIVADYNVIAPYLYSLPKAKWIQGTWAGADPIIKAYNPAKPLPYSITRFSGPFFGMQMSEYVVAHMVYRERHFLSMYESQKKHFWEKDDWFPYRPSIFDYTIGILGTGTIGLAIAKVLKTFNATVWGVGRTPLENDAKVPFLDEFRLVEDLPEVLRNCDYIINVLPETSSTIGLLGGDMLKHCSAKKSVFINIGRGSIISEKDLLRALDEKWLSGAVLDVFPTEPLPNESPLWDMPQVTITPHIAGITRPKDVASFFKENYARFQSGQSLLHELDLAKGY